ncbi:arylamine N-acetyltransferase family protein [Amycolatopsis palatopharyngis]|uniref:arylamine N-acetyltransferase family protein n=1 Tax=Amycolatopsis palatopharyngis TaxID=187982 RepID=UPI000E253C20|nr:arylamine N-acetyltransferase [Amycolatopsis palatopharyngis]
MDTTTVRQKTATDEWGAADLDLDAYLHRIGQSRAEPSVASLTALHEAHVRTIPFENIDPLLGRSPELELAAISAKLVQRDRGGYCYEHGLLFAAALEQLGYQVTRLAARIAPDKPGPKTHLNLLVRAEGIEHLADVGFGAGVLRPMPLRDGVVVDQAGWQHRLTRDGRLWRLEKLGTEGWSALHAFDETPQHHIDYEVFNHYVATHPRSPFTGQLVVMRLEYGVSRKLVGDRLTIEHADGRTEESSVPPERLDATLRDLDIVLAPTELDAVIQLYHRTTP